MVESNNWVDTIDNDGSPYAELAEFEGGASSILHQVLTSDKDKATIDRLANMVIENESMQVKLDHEQDVYLIDSSEGVAEPGSIDAARERLSSLYDTERDNVIRMVQSARDNHDVLLAPQTYEALIAIDDDKYISNEVGDMGKAHFNAVRDHLKSERIVSASADGVDFSREADASSVREREHAIYRESRMSHDAKKQLDEITGPVQPNTADEYQEPKKLAAGFSEYLRAHGRDDKGRKIEPDLGLSM